MTEDEATKKICPLSMEPGKRQVNCHSSGCMLWRWENIHEKKDGYCGLAPLEINCNVRTTKCK